MDASYSDYFLIRRLCRNLALGSLHIHAGTLGGIYDKAIALDTHLFACVNITNDFILCELNTIIIATPYHQESDESHCQKVNLCFHKLLFL